jgi:hypothetical protein
LDLRADLADTFGAASAGSRHAIESISLDFEQ